MIGLIQKLLQLAVILGLAYVIWKPSVLPEKIQPVGYSVQRWMFGSEVSLASAQSTWLARWTWLTIYVPPLANWTKSVFTAPPPVTAEGVLQWFNKLLWKQPMNKLETIKQNFYESPVATSSGLPSPNPVK